MTDVSIESSAGWPAEVPELDALFLETIGTPAGRQDPYGRYRVLRETAPVYRSGVGFVVCTRYEECQLALRDPHLGKDEVDRAARARERFGHLEIFPNIQDLSSRPPSLLFLNPPDHTRLRGLVSKAFTPRTVERLRPHIVELVDELLDRIPTGEVVDAMEALAYRLPVAVISAMLGVPSSDWPRFREVVGRVTVLLEPVIGDDEIGPAFEAEAELEEYFADLVARRRQDPGDDLLSTLIAVEEGTDKLSETELISTAILLFAAGFETTTNLIGNGLLALLRNPDQLARLRADLAADGSGGSGSGSGGNSPAIRSAVEELLRYDSPVQFDGRQVFEAVELGGVPLGPGSQVITVLGAANRDPARFTDPERLDLRRDEGPPMSFASGIHFCLGAALARAEGQVVFERLLARFGGIELATDSPTFKNRITLRGLAELPVVLSV
ncbi:MAG TPA: cytochrome P450 [Acidimicrobiales bacterium]|nr:cytochrome P450 [Acidimicrobiales bacterium]